jgi:hypothetical protein
MEDRAPNKPENKARALAALDNGEKFIATLKR